MSIAFRMPPAPSEYLTSAQRPRRRSQGEHFLTPVTSLAANFRTSLAKGEILRRSRLDAIAHCGCFIRGVGPIHATWTRALVLIGVSAEEASMETAREQNQMVTVEEAAEMLGITSAQTIDDWLRRTFPRAQTTSGEVLLHLSDVQAMKARMDHAADCRHVAPSIP